MAPSEASLIHDGLVRLLDACRAGGAADSRTGLEVSDTQARILRQLDAEDPTMVGELADYFGVTPSTMSLNLKRLEEAGCIRRARDPDDGRVMNVRLTDVGLRVKAGSSPLDLAKVDAALQELRPEERGRAVAGIRFLLEGISRASARKADYLEALTEGGGPR